LIVNTIPGPHNNVVDRRAWPGSHAGFPSGLPAGKNDFGQQLQVACTLEGLSALPEILRHCSATQRVHAINLTCIGSFKPRRSKYDECLHTLSSWHLHWWYLFKPEVKVR